MPLTESRSFKKSLSSNSDFALSEARQNRNMDIRRAEGSLFISSAISSHLRELNYPGNIESLQNCGKYVCSCGRILEEPTQFLLMKCSCYVKLIPLVHRCNSRLCFYCSITRKKRIRRSLLPRLEHFRVISPKAHNTMGKGLRFLTISPKNYKSLKTGLKEIRYNLSKFLRRKYIENRIKGMIYIIEAKIGSDSLWNVHLHAIVYGKYLDNKLRGKCLKCGQNLIKKDSVTKKFYCANGNCNSKNVFVKYDGNSRLVQEWKATSDEDIHMWVTTIDSHSKLVNYLLKYISTNKQDFQTDKQVAQYLCATYKHRLITTIGKFYHMPISKCKEPLICPFCNSEISFIYDLEIIEAMRTDIDPPELSETLIGHFKIKKR